MLFVDQSTLSATFLQVYTVISLVSRSRSDASKLRTEAELNLSVLSVSLRFWALCKPRAPAKHISQGVRPRPNREYLPNPHEFD